MRLLIPGIFALVGAALLPACAGGPASAPDPARLAAISASADTHSLDSDGYIRQWLVLGPIYFDEDYSGEKINTDQVKNEAALAPRAGDTLTIHSLEDAGGVYQTVPTAFTWVATSAGDYFFDLNKIFKLDTSERVGAYAVAYLDAPEEIKGVQFGVCTNDSGKLFLNGKSIYVYPESRTLADDEDIVSDLTLRKGINVVIFKVWNSNNNWQGCVCVLDKNGAPLTAVKVRQPK